MNLLLSVAGYVCLALATGLGAMWSLGRLIAWGLAREQRRSRAKRAAKATEPQ